MKKLPIGISDFRKVILDNNYFVDKSMLIHELINSNAQISLLPRPRRFGKTLNLSMLRYFFENREDNGYLFKELEIYKRDEFKTHQGKYPVIFLTFKDVKNGSFQDAMYGIRDLITQEYDRYYDDIKEMKLSIREKRIIDSILNCSDSNRDYENSIFLLSKLLYQKYNQDIFLLYHPHTFQ